MRYAVASSTRRSQSDSNGRALGKISREREPIRRRKFLAPHRSEVAPFIENRSNRHKDASSRAPGLRHTDFDLRTALFMFPGSLRQGSKNARPLRAKAKSPELRASKSKPANSPLASRAKSPVIPRALAEQLDQQGFGDRRPTTKIWALVRSHLDPFPTRVFRSCGSQRSPLSFRLWRPVLLA